MPSRIPAPIYTDIEEFISDTTLDEKKIIWTNGCFDLLHAGHIHSLREAASLGDYLIVGLNSDQSVQRLKGTDRPIISQQDRAMMLASLIYVNAVIIFDTIDPCHVLERLRPHIFAKGAEYDIDDLPEAKLVRSYGGKVTTLSMHDGISTTEIIKKLRQ